MSAIFAYAELEFYIGVFEHFSGSGLKLLNGWQAVGTYVGDRLVCFVL